MESLLDIKQLNTGFVNIKIGRLTHELISLLNLNRKECDIILWEDRFKYIQKHVQHFKSIEEFEKHMSHIPYIIKNPDYIGKHPKDNSIQFIKRLDELMLVAIRIKDTGNLAFRSAYPLSEKQLEDYLKCETAFKVKSVDKSVDKKE